jgi:hypothetical protein
MEETTFQRDVYNWLTTCFGPQIANDKIERNYRFLEEALELVQSLGCTKEDAYKLVDYVFERPLGEPQQEVGGVMITIAALCIVNNINMYDAGNIELNRVWEKIDKIKAKHDSKQIKSSPLPGTTQL